MSVFAKGNTALITGGASGIGLAVARICAKHGMRVVLVDNNAKNLALAQKELGDNTKTYALDVSKTEAWQQLQQELTPDLHAGLPDDAAGKVEGVDLLMLNAGRAIQKQWDSYDYFNDTFATNLFGVTNGIATFWPLFKQTQKPRAVVITGSKQGITNPPGNPAYNATKAAVKSLAETLSYELAESEKSRASVHLLVPGWTFTGLSGGGPGSSRDKPGGAWSPEQVAQRLENQVSKGQDGFWCICPDNDVTEEMDKKRMLWSAGDAVYDRPPLSRWRGSHKDEAQKWMDAQKF